VRLCILPFSFRDHSHFLPTLGQIINVAILPIPVLIRVTGGVGMSEAELLRARAKCFLEWAIQAGEPADFAEYLKALARECLEDAAALDAMQGRKSSQFDPQHSNNYSVGPAISRKRTKPH
jgi:hypothetical protein